MVRLLTLGIAWALAGCDDQLPTAVDEDLLQAGPATFEVMLPWSEFASNLRVLGGFGRAYELSRGYLADGYRGTMTAHTLLHLNEFPVGATVRDTAGVTQLDTMLTFIQGELLVRFDTVTSTNIVGDVFLTGSLPLTSWHTRSATWETAVDTAGTRVTWPEPGGGPVVPLGAGIWRRAVGDSAFIVFGPSEVAALGDSANAEMGLRLETTTAGERLEILQVQLRLLTVPSSNPDTLIYLLVDPTDMTFIYTPESPAPTDEIRVGGVPAWRSILTLNVPTSVPGSPAACVRAPCPVALTPERLNHAALALTSRTDLSPFAPTDSLRLDARVVLAPDFLPKSPLGSSLFIQSSGEQPGTRVPPLAFVPGGARTVEIPVTPLVRELVRGETPSGGEPSTTIALMSLFEPLTLGYGSFVGPGEPGEPFLRMIITVSEQVVPP